MEKYKYVGRRFAGQKTFTERKTEITTSKRNRQRIREMNIL